jgi:SAM-dependent methyltransferase
MELSMNVDTNLLTRHEQQEIDRLLALAKHNPPTVQDIWQMMDRVWDELGCNSKHLDTEKVSEFYSHPIWMLNGLFIEQDPLSMQHRNAIASWTASQNFSAVLDYGGGFGTLARLIAQQATQLPVDVYEPFPGSYALERAQAFRHLNYISQLTQQYDCVFSVDVLEHVERPLELLETLLQAVKLDGYLVVAARFYPDIKCHLPSTFHYRYTFDKFAELMGLKVIGPCQGSHAKIYQRIDTAAPDWGKIRSLEVLSRVMFPILRPLEFGLKVTRRTFRSVLA